MALLPAYWRFVPFDDPDVFLLDGDRIVPIRLRAEGETTGVSLLESAAAALGGAAGPIDAVVGSPCTGPVRLRLDRGERHACMLAESMAATIARVECQVHRDVMGRLAAGFRHEMRGSLGVLGLNLQLLERASARGDALADALAGALPVLRARLADLGRLHETLLDDWLSGEAAMPVAGTDPLGDVLRLCRAALGHRGVGLEPAPDAAFPPSPCPRRLWRLLAAGILAVGEHAGTGAVLELETGADGNGWRCALSIRRGGPGTSPSQGNGRPDPLALLGAIAWGLAPQGTWEVRSDGGWRLVLPQAR